MPTTADIARAWRGVPFLDPKWYPVPRRTLKNTRCGGAYVTCDELDGRPAYMKPLQRWTGTFSASAAREKIASDLAYDLGIMVPPAVLTLRQASARTDERNVCASLVVYDKQLDWDTVNDALMVNESSDLPAIVATLPGPAAKAFAFDTWVHQGDHDHPSNIIWGYDKCIGPSQFEGDRRGFVFLDYEGAFGRDVGVTPQTLWHRRDYMVVAPVPFPEELRKRMDPQVLEETVRAIENYPEDQIRDIVGRIPSSHMTAGDKQFTVEGLLARRGLVRLSLASFLQE